MKTHWECRHVYIHYIRDYHGVYNAQITVPMNFEPLFCFFDEERFQYKPLTPNRLAHIKNKCAQQLAE